MGELKFFFGHNSTCTRHACPNFLTMYLNATLAFFPKLKVDMLTCRYLQSNGEKMATSNFHTAPIFCRIFPINAWRYWIQCESRLNAGSWYTTTLGTSQLGLIPAFLLDLENLDVCLVFWRLDPASGRSGGWWRMKHQNNNKWPTRPILLNTLDISSARPIVFEQA